MKDVHKEPYNRRNKYKIMLNEQNVLQTMINEIEKNIETNSDEYFTNRYYLEHFITPKVRTHIGFIGSSAIDASGLSKQIYTSVSREIIKLEDSGADESKEEDVIELESKEAEKEPLFKTFGNDCKYLCLINFIKMIWININI